MGRGSVSSDGGCWGSERGGEESAAQLPQQEEREEGEQEEGEQEEGEGEQLPGRWKENQQ